MEMERYSVIEDKNPREIVLLRGTGCKWGRCAFCDYHLDRDPDPAANFELNRAVLARVTGVHRHLEVINSGSFVDLDPDTLDEIARVCAQKQIKTLHFECHFIHRHEVPALRERFAALGVTVKVKTGVETFDRALRETVLHKGIGTDDPADIARYFDECCLLFGLSGQTEASMRHDIETALAHFERVCVNIMAENSTPVKPDPAVIACFRERIYPQYAKDPRIDILLHNTDFGVGGEVNV